MPQSSSGARTAPKAGEQQCRDFSLATATRERSGKGATRVPGLDVDARTLTFTFSSEQPVQRWFGDEVLSHRAGAADLSRLNDSAPLLFNHNMDDVVGVVERAWINASMKGECTVRFAKTARGDELMSMVADGILRNVSFMYQALAYRVEEDEADQAADPTYTATKWLAYEVSIVTVPADSSVGVGRSLKSSKGKQMPAQSHDDNDGGNETVPLSRRKSAQAHLGILEERERIQELKALCRMHGATELEEGFVNNGVSVAEARQAVLERMLARSQSQPVASAHADGVGGMLGLSSKETRTWSMLRAVHGLASRDFRKVAPFEFECHEAMEKMRGQRSMGILMPPEVMRNRPWLDTQTRAPYLVGTPTQGGNLVATELYPDLYVEALRNSSQVIASGGRVLSGLGPGNVDIPRQTGVTNTYWVAESGAVTESEATFDKLQLRPKTLGCLSKMSRLMLLQSSPAVEMLARADMMAQIGIAIDLAALSGPGTGNQPTGIANTAGIGSVVGGTNGANLISDYMIALEAAIANSNAPYDTRGYIINTKSVATLKKEKASTGAYIWSTSGTGQRSGTPPNLNGYPVAVSNNVRSTLTKGTSAGICSEVFFGAWNELIIAQWGVLEILVNPYDSTGFPSGDVLVRALQTLDIAVRHPVSFAYMADALTP